MEIINKLPNIFICGLSGSGKDTTLKHILAIHPEYLKIRCAETIKRMVTEVNNISFDELEVQKRIEPKLRSQHNEFDNMMRPFTGKPEQISSANRYKMIVNRTSMDFTNPVLDANKEQLLTNPICVFDGRDSEACNTFIKSGFIGIFLTRSNSEFRNRHHETEADNISNGTIEELCKLGFAENIIIIDNDDVKRDDIYELDIKYPELLIYNIGRIDSRIFDIAMKSILTRFFENVEENIKTGKKVYRLK